MDRQIGYRLGGIRERHAAEANTQKDSHVDGRMITLIARKTDRQPL